MKRLQARKGKLNFERLAGSVPQIHAAWYESSQCFGILGVSAALKQNNRLTLAFQDEAFEPCKSSLAAFLTYAFIPEKHRASSFFSIEEVKFLKTLIWVWGAQQYGEEREVQGPDDISIWSRAAASLY